MNKLNVQTFQNGSLNEIFRFISENPWKPVWSDDLILRFLTELVSTSELVFDVFDEKKRVGVAVLLDKVQNKGNHANLEILGLSVSPYQTRILREIIRISKERIPNHKNGFEVGFCSSFDEREFIAKEDELELYYQTFEMRNESFSFIDDTASGFVLATPAHDHELYQVLLESFRDSIDTGIPEFNEWAAARHRDTNAITCLKQINKRTVGFLNLILNPSLNSAEIRTIGVLPSFRNQGIGRELIVQALTILKQRQITRCELTVATQNKRALELYRRLGFKEKDHYLVYVWRRDLERNQRS